MFDSKAYWKNRKAHKRGQGELLPKVYGEFQAVSTKPVTKKALAKNTKRARKQEVA